MNQLTEYTFKISEGGQYFIEIPNPPELKKQSIEAVFVKASDDAVIIQVDTKSESHSYLLADLEEEMIDSIVSLTNLGVQFVSEEPATKYRAIVA